MGTTQRRRSRLTLAATLGLWLAACGDAPTMPDRGVAEYVGSATCAECHQAEYEAWRGSHHELAMSAVGPESVTGDFSATVAHGEMGPSEFRTEGDRFVVRTTGPDGEPSDFEVRFTFGTTPLQQYLLPLSGGRLQAFTVAWDVVDERWFHLQPPELKPDDDLHWTGPGHNWNTMCADCHSTHVVKNYDPETRTYGTTFAEVSVGCEACHGPGSGHVDQARSGTDAPTGILRLSGRDPEINACAPCHSRRSQLADGFIPHAPFLDYYSPSLLDDGLYFADGQIDDEVYVYGSFLQSRMHASGVTCSDCHEPHSARLRAEGNALCVTCHNEVGRPDFPTLPKGVFDHPDHHLHEVGSPGSLCVNCHMPERVYMGIDGRRDHSLRVPRPDLDTGAPDACTGCHGDRDPDWAADVLREAFGPPGEHFAPAFADARRGLPGKGATLAGIATDEVHAPIVRATALSLLSGYDGERVRRALAMGTRDPSPLVRIGAARGAAAWPPEALWRLARPLLEDELLAVRVEATPILAPVLGDLPAEDRALLQAGIDEYLDVLEFNADRPDAYTNRGNLHLAMGKTDLAEADYGQALELQPRWIPALVNLADLYRATGRDGLGGPLLARASRIAPEIPEVLVAYGLWMVRQGRHSEALQLLARAAASPTSHGRFAYVHAVALQSGGDSRAALAALDRGIALRPGDAQLLRTALGIAVQIDDEAKAREYRDLLQAQHESATNPTATGVP